MGRIATIFLFFIFFLIIPISIDASSISYNDLLVDNNFELNSQNFSNINLIIDDNIISYDQVTINYQTDDLANITVDYNGTIYNFDVLLSRFDNTKTTASFGRRLDIDDDFAVDNSSVKDIVCSVYSEKDEIIDVNVDKNSNADGITTANLTCNSQYIFSSSIINTVNTNDNSVYGFSGDQILYAEDFKYNIEEIDSLTNNEILEFSNAQSTYGDITVSNINDNIITLLSGDISVQIEILEDEKPELNKSRYYNIDYLGNYDINSIFDITDDTDGELDIDIDLNEDVGIYLKKIAITDEANNKVEDEVLIILNDGRYKITNDELYILDTSFNTFYNDQKNYIDVYNIDELDYENVEASFFTTDYVDTSLDLAEKEIENEYTFSNKIEDENKSPILAIVIIIAMLALMILL